MIGIDLRFYDGKYDGGVFNICLSIIRSLNSNNIFLYVFTRNHFCLDKLQSHIDCNSNIYVVKPLRVSYLFDSFFLGHSIFPRSIHTVIWPYYCVPFLNPPRRRYILGLWDITPITHPHSYKFPIKYIFPILMRVSALRASKVLSCSLYDCSQIRKYIPNVQPLSYFPLPINFSKYLSFHRKSVLDDQQSSLTFTSYGSLYDRRLIPLILKSLTLLHSHGFDVTFNLIGRDSTSAQNIDYLCSTVPYKLNRFDYLDDTTLDSILNDSDFGICLSDQDGTSYIILEYALRFIPVITTDLMSEELNGKCISLSHQSSPEAFLLSILNYLDLPYATKYDICCEAITHIRKTFPNLSDPSIVHLVTS